MGFTEEISRQFGRFSKRTSAFVEEARLRGRIRILEADIKELYTSAGMSMFSMWRHENVDTDKLVKYFDAIQHKFDEIKEKEDQIRQVKEKAAQTSGTNEEEAAARPGLPDDLPERTVIDGVVDSSEDKAILQDNEPVLVEEETASSESDVITTENTYSSNEVITEEEVKTNVFYCPTCGEACSLDANFCRKCGTRLR